MTTRIARRPVRLAGAAFALGLLSLAGPPVVSADPAPYSLYVQVASARGAVPGVVKAALRFNAGYRLLAHSPNRLSRLSALDEGVTLDRQVVKSATEGQALVFTIDVTTTKPGSHPIN